MADINLHSFLGGVNDGQLVDWSDQEINGLGFTDTLKLTSKLKDFTGKFGNVIGGTEDCLDINNECRNVSLIAASWSPKGRFLCTAKGGSVGVLVRGDVLTHGNEVDVDLGNWSDQSSEKTRVVTLGLQSKDNKPISIRVLNADKPILLPNTGPYKYVFPWPWLGFMHTVVVKVLFAYYKLTKK